MSSSAEWRCRCLAGEGPRRLRPREALVMVGAGRPAHRGRARVAGGPRLVWEELPRPEKSFRGSLWSWSGWIRFLAALLWQRLVGGARGAGPAPRPSHQWPERLIWGPRMALTARPLQGGAAASPGGTSTRRGALAVQLGWGSPCAPRAPERLPSSHLGSPSSSFKTLRLRGVQYLSPMEQKWEARALAQR